jgi:hypothetical protein
MEQMAFQRRDLGFASPMSGCRLHACPAFEIFSEIL